MSLYFFDEVKCYRTNQNLQIFRYGVLIAKLTLKLEFINICLNTLVACPYLLVKLRVPHSVLPARQTSF